MKPLVLLRFLYSQYRLWFWSAGLLVAILIGIRTCQRAERVDAMHWQFVESFGIRLPMHYTLHGIDVSRHNARINWQQVGQVEANGVKLGFVFIKATEGATLGDKNFNQNWRGAGKAGLRRGAYHFYHPTRDPVKQAKNFIKRVTLSPGDFAPVLDFEVINGVAKEDIIRDLHIWLDYIEAHYNARPIIYTNAHHYKKYIKDNFDAYPLWIADYSNPNLARYNADKLYIWQHNEGGRVRGISNLVDFNVLVVEPERLAEICL